MSGLDVARRLRTDGVDVSILMLTARDTVNDRVTGLDAGADDYLVKPFAYQEVAARLRALARRAEPGPRRADPVLDGGRDHARRGRAAGHRRRPQRRPQPARVLAARGLLRHPGQTLTRDQLLDHAWPFSVAVTPNAVDAYVHYLRDEARRGGLAGSRRSAASATGSPMADGDAARPSRRRRRAGRPRRRRAGSSGASAGASWRGAG